MTVSPVIPATPAQATVGNRPSGSSKEQSKDFYSYLRSSAQEGSDKPASGVVSERAAKVDKDEKPTGKKADAVDPAANVAGTPVPPPTVSQPVPPLSITALLGLPTVPNTDVAETGKPTSDGEAVLFSPGSEPSVATDESLSIKPESVTPPSTPHNFGSVDQLSVQAKTEWLGRAEVPLTKPESVVDNQPNNNPQILQRAAQASPDVTAPVLKPGLIDPSLPSSAFLTSATKGVVKEEKAKVSRSQQKNTDNSTGTTINPAPLSASQTPQIDLPKADSDAAPVSSMSTVVSSDAKTSVTDLPVANTVPDGAESSSIPGTLAFAMRLNEEPVNTKLDSPAPQTSPTEPVAGMAQTGNASLAATVEAAVKPQLKEQSQGHDESAGTVFYGTSQMQRQSVSDSPSPSSSSQESHTTAAGLQTNPETANTEPVRNVHMQVVGDNNSRVDVHLVDRGGALHVSVKSGDINLAQNLQDHMPELTARLEQQRFQAEVWVPKLADNGKTETSGTRDFSSNGNGSSNGNNNSDGQGKKQQQYQPDWVDVLENSTHSAGKTNQAWLQ